MTTFDAMFSVRVLDRKYPYGTEISDGLGPVVEKILADPQPDVVVEALDAVIAPLDAKIGDVSDALAYRNEEFVDFSYDSRCKIDGLEARIERYEALGESFDEATRFGWKLTAGDGFEVESRCLDSDIAKAEARRMIALFGSASPDAECECFVLDYSESFYGEVVYQVSLKTETGERS